MKRFICSNAKTYSNIINICEDNEGIITFKNANGEIITENANALPEGIILAHPRSINPSVCLRKWLKDNYEHRHKQFEPDFSLNAENSQTVEVSKHLSIWLKVEGNKILWNHTTHNLSSFNF